MSQMKDKKTGKWFYYGAYVDEKGIKHQYKKRGFASQRLARKAEDAFRDVIDSGNYTKKNKTFKQVTTEFQKWSKNNLKESTYITDQQSYNKIYELFGEMDVRKITYKFLQDHINELDQQYSKKYVEKLYYTISKVFNYAVDHNYILVNPLKKVKVAARKNDLKKEMLFWEPSTFNDFIGYVDNTTYRTLFSFLYYMGCRRGEALALQWKDINFDNRCVLINKTVSFKSYPYKITPPKTRNSVRTISIPLSLINMLTIYKKEQQQLYEYDQDKFVFGYDRPIPPESIRRIFKKCIMMCNKEKEASDEIPEIRLHDLRHSHASYLLNNKSNKFTDYDIAKRLGDTVQTLHNTYAHWFNSADKGIIDFMDSDLSKC